MSVPFVLLAIVYLFGCVALVGAILLQEKRSAGGMGSIAGMGNIAESYAGKNKGRTQEGTLERLTKIAAVVLAIVSVVLCII